MVRSTLIALILLVFAIPPVAKAYWDVGWSVWPFGQSVADQCAHSSLGDKLPDNARLADCHAKITQLELMVKMSDALKTHTASIDQNTHRLDKQSEQLEIVADQCTNGFLFKDYGVYSTVMSIGFYYAFIAVADTNKGKPFEVLILILVIPLLVLYWTGWLASWGLALFGPAFARGLWSLVQMGSSLALFLCVQYFETIVELRRAHRLHRATVSAATATTPMPPVLMSAPMTASPVAFSAKNEHPVPTQSPPQYVYDSKYERTATRSTESSRVDALAMRHASALPDYLSLRANAPPAVVLGHTDVDDSATNAHAPALSDYLSPPAKSPVVVLGRTDDDDGRRSPSKVASVDMYWSSSQVPPAQSSKLTTPSAPRVTRASNRARLGTAVAY